jgi:hypothetical protein
MPDKDAQQEHNYWQRYQQQAKIANNTGVLVFIYTTFSSSGCSKNSLARFLLVSAKMDPL